MATGGGNGRAGVPRAGLKEGMLKIAAKKAKEAREASRAEGEEGSSAPYTSRIIKAGALLDDTKTLLAHWDTQASVPENLDRVRRENVFGKASRSRVEDILAVFRQRY